jgi:hypothetical protein
MKEANLLKAPLKPTWTGFMIQTRHELLYTTVIDFYPRKAPHIGPGQKRPHTLQCHLLAITNQPANLETAPL